MKTPKQKRRPRLSMLAGSITLAVLAYLVAFFKYWIPGWWREGEDSTMTIVFIIGMTGMFFTLGLILKRLDGLEARTRFTERWAARQKKAVESAKAKVSKRRKS